MPHVTQTSPTDGDLQAGGLLLTAWGPVSVCFAALAFALCGIAAARHPGIVHQALSTTLSPLALFAAGLAPMIGAGLVVWTARHTLSPAERRSQLVGASLSAVLFFPALLLARAFT